MAKTIDEIKGMNLQVGTPIKVNAYVFKQCKIEDDYVGHFAGCYEQIGGKSEGENHIVITVSKEDAINVHNEYDKNHPWIVDSHHIIKLEKIKTISK